MKIIQQSHEILRADESALKFIEIAARNCYKSEDKITHESSKKIVSQLIKSNHMAMIEFSDMVVKFITDRSVTHELVRHRLCSFSQTSQRYVNYSKPKFNHEIEFIKPIFFDDWSKEQQQIWINLMREAEYSYMKLTSLGIKAEEARGVLPNSTKTEIIVKANLREWRHIFQLRCNKKAHPQIRSLMKNLLKDMQEEIPVIPIIFDDIYDKFFPKINFKG